MFFKKKVVTKEEATIKDIEKAFLFLLKKSTKKNLKIRVWQEVLKSIPVINKPTDYYQPIFYIENKGAKEKVFISFYGRYLAFYILNEKNQSSEISYSELVKLTMNYFDIKIRYMNEDSFNEGFYHFFDDRLLMNLPVSIEAGDVVMEFVPNSLESTRILIKQNDEIKFDLIYKHCILD